MCTFCVFFASLTLSFGLCVASQEMTASTTTGQTVLPVLNPTTKPPLPATASTTTLVSKHQNQTLPTDDDDDDEGEDLPSEIINAGRSPRPTQPLSSSDLEEKLRRLTETMEKIQRGDQDERDVAASKGQNGNDWASRSFEHSGSRPPWDQSDDEDEPYHGSGSGSSEATHPTANMEDDDDDDDDTMRGSYAEDKYNRKQATPDRPGSSGHRSLHGITVRTRLLCAGFATALMYRWMR